MTYLRRSIPMLMTGVNAGCGMAAIIFALQGSIHAPLWLLLVAALFDGLDGWAARRLNVAGYAGANADTVADIMSFGIAPAFVVALEPNPFTIAAAFFYGIMILVRLARYRLVKMPQGVFLGIPAPVTALALVGFAQMAHQGGWPGVSHVFAALVFGVIAVLPFQAPAWHHPSIRMVPLSIRLVYFFGGIAFLFAWPEESVLVTHLVYIIAGPVLLQVYLGKIARAQRLGEERK